MAFTTNPYATLQDVKDALGYSSTNTKDDAWISKLLVQAQATLDKEIGYSFQTDGSSNSPATRTYSGNGRSSMMINDCISVAQVQEYVLNAYLYNGNGIWYSSTPNIVDITADTILGPDNASPGYMLFRTSNTPFVAGRRNYVVSGVFGYPSIPPDISYACTLIAVHNLKKRETNYADVLVEAAGSKQHYTKQLTPDIIEIIELYKHRTFVSRV